MRKRVMARVALLPIGREILTGRVQDTNSAYLASRFFDLGQRVIRICAVDDDPVAISRELRRCRADGANLVICTGGLGPTPDDITLYAVARTTCHPLKEDPEALAHVERRYRELFEQRKVEFPEITEDRRKMALIPTGARILSNNVGTAPGVELRWGSTRIFCLPGVPAEMRPMAEAYVFSCLRPTGNTVMRRSTVSLPVCDESTLAALIRHLKAAHPDVLMKPDPKGFGTGREMLVHLECEGTPGEVEARLAAAARALEEAVMGFTYHSPKHD